MSYEPVTWFKVSKPWLTRKFWRLVTSVPLAPGFRRVEMGIKGRVVGEEEEVGMERVEVEGV